jgi:integrase
VAVIEHGREDGHRTRKWASFSTKREAEAHLLKHASHPSFGSGLGPYGSTRRRVGEYLEQWLDDIKDRIRPSTHRRYSFLVNGQLKPGLGHIPLYRLTVQDIERCYRDLHGRVSSTTAHHAAALLREALKHAKRVGLTLQNPADDAESPRRVNKERALWTVEQAARFLDGTKRSRYGLLYALLIGTGLRIGEALSLQWSDVDFSHGTLAVRAGKTANARRTVLLPEILLRDLHAARGVGLIFHRNGRPLDSKNVRERDFYSWAKKLELPRIRVHDLRHLHATMLLVGGVDLAAVSARLGHSSKAFTLATYGHVLAGAQKQAAVVANQVLRAGGGD